MMVRTQEEIDLLKRADQLGKETKQLLDDLAALPTINQHWLAIGREDLAIGMIAVERAITREERK
jgi:hypothetical protein